ncbi:MAG: bifunctional ADP-heptose synthase [Anaerolineae bacterium]
MITQLKHLIPRMANRRVLVLGDIFLDEYLIGKATRMSREAPVPVLEFESRRLLPGGAGNPAANITALGSQAVQIGVVGDDAMGTQLREVLRARGIDTSGIITDANRPTTVKTRIMAQMGLRFPQQVARLDRLSRDPISAEIQAQIMQAVRDQLTAADAVLFSDYQTGLLTSELVNGLRTMAAGVLLTADAQGELAKYAGFTLVKCNADEARTYLQRDLVSDEDFNRAACDLYDALELTGAMVITRGAEGITLGMAGGTTHHSPAPLVTDVYDTVGAGDTTIAVMALALTAGAQMAEAAALANYASGLVVRRVGNYAPSPEELRRALEP